jgi:LuxR family transcriptional regulator, maltose regulon positive regulatory protein
MGLLSSPCGAGAGSRGGRPSTQRRADRDPATRRDAVDRPRLLKALESGGDARLTLVTGPPGSGKTVLLSSWRDARDAPTALISLGPGDRTLAGLWRKLSQALPAPARSDARAAPHTPGALAGRVLELTAPQSRGAARTLIFDDFHLADGPAVRETLATLLSAEPSPHVVIGSRTDPALPLQRLRLTGALSELNGIDLDFTIDESRALLANEGITLSRPALQRLWARTEGWAAGLRLAALSLTGHADPDTFVEDFAGDDRAVVAYLVEEVLEHQSPPARELLLATAVVDRISPSLANALTGRDDAVTIFDELQRANAFLIPLDRRGEWFRYHRLFADLLRAQLARRGPAVVARQHRRAARWFMAQDRPQDALAHAIAAEDWDGTTAILSGRWLKLRAADGGAALDRALEALPPGAIARRPEAALVAAVRCLDHDEDLAADAHLLTAARLRHRLPGSRRAAVTRELSLVRLLRCGRDGDLAGAALELQTLVNVGQHDPPRWRDLAALAQLEVARLETDEGVDGSERRLGLAARLAAGSARSQLTLEAGAQRAWLHALDGRLHSARLEIDAERAGGGAGAPAPAASGLLAGALAAAEAGDVAHASELVRAARTASTNGAFTPGRLRRLEIAFVAARIAQSAGRGVAEAACADLRAALTGWTPPRLLGDRARMTAAEILVGLGRADEALAGLPDDPERCDALAVGRMAALLGARRSEPALAEGTRIAACDGLPLPVAVAAAALTAVAAEAQGDRELAQRHAERALDLAEPEGVRLSLATAMDALDPVLHRLLRVGTAHRSLIGEVFELARSGTAVSPVAVAPLDEPLSRRELIVLRYLPTLLSSAEIAGELFLSVNTVKSHLKGIYRKLGVGNRRMAVERARDLGLISVSGLSVERRPPAP